MPCNLKAYAKKTEVELRYIIKDAAEAAVAMRGVSDDAERKYLDQVNDATTVLATRAAKLAARKPWICDECKRPMTEKQAVRAMEKGCPAGCSGLDVHEVLPDVGHGVAPFDGGYDDPAEGPVATPHDAWYAEQAAARRAAELPAGALHTCALPVGWVAATAAGVPYVDVSWVHEYGLSQKLSTSIRVF